MYTSKPSSDQAKQGFTLMELLVSLTIVGLLLGIGVPNYQRFIAKTKISATLTELQPYQLILLEEFLNHGNLAHLDARTLHLPSMDAWKKRCPWIHQVQVQQGHIEVLMNTNALGMQHPLLGEQLTLILKHPFDQAAQQQALPFNWQCEIQTQGLPSSERQKLLSDYLPKMCLQP